MAKKIHFKMPYLRYMDLVLCMIILFNGGTTQGEPEGDNFNIILDRVKNVTAENCHSKHRWELELPRESVSHVPMYIYEFFDAPENRSKLLHLRNTAMSRGLYYSFLYDMLNQSKYFKDEPDLVFLYMKSSSDVSANQGWIDGSALMYDGQCHYPNWIQGLDFNKTLSLFGVRAWKGENEHYTSTAREPLGSTNEELITGTVFQNDTERNYTHPGYKYSPYTRYGHEKFWWPDATGYRDTLRKKIYSVEVKVSNATGQFKTENFEKIRIYGPPTPAVEFDPELPVLMTPPYFDCGRSNKWIVSMTSPVIEYMARYNAWQHIRRPRFTAVAAMDQEFMNIDFNPCELSLGNPQPNFLAGTARCRLATTVCEPLPGFGFRRGGYQCVCRHGLYYPWGQEGPFQGADIERATEEEINNGTFDCVTVEELAKYSGDEEVSPAQKEDFEIFDNETWTKAKTVLAMGKSTPETCDKTVLLTNGKILGASRQFEAQGRMALTIAHFLSNFLQNTWALHDSLYSNNEYTKQPANHYLKESYVFGDVVAALISDVKLAGMGVYFDRNKFLTAADVSKELFAPYAFRIPPSDEANEADYRAVDLAGNGVYADEDWFLTMKQKWTTDVADLERFTDSSATYSDSEISFRAPTYTDGEWSGPHYKCDGMLTDWVFTYRVPFIGLDSASELEFKGIVAVDVKLDLLDINQCPAENSTDNVFSNTAKCHYETQYCLPVPGKQFNFGGYRCVYRQGYEIPSNFFFHHGNSIYGDAMEEEHGKNERNETNSYDELKGEAIQIVRTTKAPVGGAAVFGGSAVKMIVFALSVLHILMK